MVTSHPKIQQFSEKAEKYEVVSHEIIQKKIIQKKRNCILVAPEFGDCQVARFTVK